MSACKALWRGSTAFKSAISCHNAATQSPGPTYSNCVESDSVNLQLSRKMVDQLALVTVLVMPWHRNSFETIGQ